VHAHFQNRDGQPWLVDARSKNGTSVNDELLVPGQRCPVRERDRIRFGRVPALVLSSQEAFDLLARM
jgi:pSer/pThr/pTyr-binding forkhead associated (FHA) protein